MQSGNQYDVRITSSMKVVLTIILVPSLTITPLILLGAFYGPQVPAWLQYVIIYGMLVIAGMGTLMIVKRASPRAVMTLHDDELSIDFVDKGLFARKSFRILIAQITNFSIEGNDNYEYMSFATSVRPSSFNVSASDKGGIGDDRFEELKERFAQMIADHNEDPIVAAAAPITRKSMYETGFMKALALAWVVLVLATVINNLVLPLERHVPLSRILVMAVIGVPLLYKVYVANYVSRK